MYKIVVDQNRLKIMDNPMIYWTFYVVFVFAGLIALFFALFKSPDITTQIIISLISIGNIMGGIYMIKKEPASVVEFDKFKKTLYVTRWGLMVKLSKEYNLQEFSCAGIEKSEHSEGGTIYRPQFFITNDVTIPISYFWLQSDEEINSLVKKVNNYLKKI